MAAQKSKYISLVFLALFICLVAFAADALAGVSQDPNSPSKGDSTGEQNTKKILNFQAVQTYSNPNK